MDGAAVSIGDLPPLLDASDPAVCKRLVMRLCSIKSNRTYNSNRLSSAGNGNSDLGLAATASTSCTRAANRAVTHLHTSRCGNRLNGDNLREGRGM